VPNWEEIQKEWETTKITLAALTEKHDVKLGTLKSRKSREAWVRGPSVKGATKKKKDATISKRMQPNKAVKEPVVESDELTDKQQDFCVYYIKYRNKTKAYMKAYSCSWKTANAHAYRLWEIEGVRQEIDRQLKVLRDEVNLDSRDILQKYIDIAFADMTDFAGFGSEEVVARDEFGDAMTDDDGKEITYTHNFVNFKNADEVDGTIITEVKKGKDGISVKLADKMKAMEMLAKFTDLLSDNDKKKLQEEKLKAEIIKVKAETNTDETGESKTIIVTGEDEMRRVLDGKSSD